MATYVIQTTQAFNVTYRVDAESPSAAWDALLDGRGHNEDQQPGDIIGTYAESSVEEV